jgi:hypothetical protein
MRFQSVLRRGAGVALVLSLLLAGSGCSLLDGGGDGEASASDAPTTAAVEEFAVDSQFTRDGTFQSHLGVNGAPDVDFVFTIYPTKSTPRTNEWYPKGKKYFSFTFQAYDLDQEIRDPFSTKRKVYLQRMQVSSEVLTYDNSTIAQQPYTLDVIAKNATFDPEPLSTKYGMLITSPKGAFELRNQAIKPTPKNTKGINLTFTATLYAQTRAGSSSYKKMVISQKVPIAIFSSNKPTQAQSIPVDAN